MRGIAVGCWLLLGGMSVIGCGGSGPAPRKDYAGVDGIDCNQSLEGGIACGVRPSATMAGIDDSFGAHAVGVPDGLTTGTPIFVFLQGTLGIPYDEGSSSFSDAALTILQEGIDHGYLVLDVAYDRLPPIGLLCLGTDLTCFERVRQAIVQGIDDPASPKHVTPPNDVLSRADALIGFLHALDPARFPDHIDWPTTRVGGDSQGAGNIGFLAKEVRPTAHLCLLAGLGDSDGTTMAAPWVLSSTWMTPLASMRGVIHADDPYHEQTLTAWTGLGLEPGTGYRELSGATDDPHGFPISNDPEAVDAREWACFQ